MLVRFRCLCDAFISAIIMIKNIKHILLTVFTAVIISLPAAEAMAMDGWGRGHGPYGGYCRGPRGGWYGARRAVKTADDAKKILKEFFGKDAVIANVMERETFFIADVKDKSGKLVDVVIVHKRNGRIRSIF